MSFWSNPLHSVTNFFTNPVDAFKNSAETILPIAGAVGGGLIGGPAGAAAGYELGDTGTGLLKGESLGQSLEGGLPGAALAGVGAAVLPGVTDWANSTFGDTLTATAPDLGGATGSVDPGVVQAVDANGDSVALNSPNVSSFGTPTAAGTLNPLSTGAATPPAGPGFWDSVTSGNFKGALSAAGKDIANNPGSALAGGGLALDALKGNSKTGAEKNQAAYAGEQAGVGANEVALGQAGQLAPGQQQVIENQLQQTIAQIKSQYAQQGMSGSTSEQAAIAQAQQQASATIAQQAQQEINTGLSALGQASGANQAIIKQQMSSNPDLSAAILALNASSGVTSKQQPAA